MAKKVCFIIIIFWASCYLQSYVLFASDIQLYSSASSASADPNLQYEPTKELWALVSTLRQLQTDYYEKQALHKDKIQQIRDISQKLQADVEEIKSRENQIDKNLSEIQSDIQNLQIENEKNKSTESSALKTLEQFAAEQTEKIKDGIPYRKSDRLSRLNGISVAGQSSQGASVTEIFGRIWNFSQEELRIARSGETFTDQVDMGKGRLQYARLFRVGHQFLGYVTEQDGQTGIWTEGAGWEKAKGPIADSVKEAIEILDGTNVPKYVQLPIKMGPVNTQTKTEGNKK
ncbi:MAG: DUF3450 family protein [Phycisphaerae bacterium]|nr:DUF3450 family protein [Phycisphaerae bacterium]